jgi:hypothetical protein
VTLHVAGAALSGLDYVAHAVPVSLDATYDTALRALGGGAVTIDVTTSATLPASSHAGAMLDDAGTALSGLDHVAPVVSITRSSASDATRSRSSLRSAISGVLRQICGATIPQVLARMVLSTWLKGRCCVEGNDS